MKAKCVYQVSASSSEVQHFSSLEMLKLVLTSFSSLAGFFSYVLQRLALHMPNLPLKVCVQHFGTCLHLGLLQNFVP